MTSTLQTLLLDASQDRNVSEVARTWRVGDLARIVAQNLRTVPAERLLPHDAQVIVQVHLRELEAGLEQLDRHLENREPLRALWGELLGARASAFMRPSEALRAALYAQGIEVAALRSTLGERMLLVLPDAPKSAPFDFLILSEVRSMLRLARLAAVMAKRPGMSTARRTYRHCPVTVLRSGDARPTLYQALVGRRLIVTSREEWLCAAIDRFLGVAAGKLAGTQASLADNKDHRAIQTTLGAAGRPALTFYTHLPRFAWMLRLGLAVPDDVPMGIGVQIDGAGVTITTADNQPLTVPKARFGAGLLERVPERLDGRGLGVWLSAPSFRELYYAAKQDFVSATGRSAWDANFQRLACFGSLHWERDFIDVLTGEFVLCSWADRNARPIFAAAAVVHAPQQLAEKVETLLARLGSTLGAEALTWTSIPTDGGMVRTARLSVLAQGPSSLAMAIRGQVLVVGLGGDGACAPALAKLAAALDGDAQEGTTLAATVQQARAVLPQEGFSHLISQVESLEAAWQSVVPMLGAHAPGAAMLRKVQAVMRAVQSVAWMASFENGLSVTRNRFELAGATLR